MAQVVEGEEEAVPGGGEPGDSQRGVQPPEGHLGKLVGAAPRAAHTHGHSHATQSLLQVHQDHLRRATQAPAPAHPGHVCLGPTARHGELIRLGERGSVTGRFLTCVGEREHTRSHSHFHGVSILEYVHENIVLTCTKTTKQVPVNSATKTESG